MLGSSLVVKGLWLKWGGGQPSKTIGAARACPLLPELGRHPGVLQGSYRLKASHGHSSPVHFVLWTVTFSAASSGGTHSPSPGWREAAAHLDSSHSWGCICPCRKVTQYLPVLPFSGPENFVLELVADPCSIALDCPALGSHARQALAGEMHWLCLAGFWAAWLLVHGCMCASASHRAVPGPVLQGSDTARQHCH